MEHSKPLAIDLYAGLGGWTDGLLAEGYDVIGFDIERHRYGDARYPAQLVIQDVLTLHGSQFRNADLIVASPPCQEFSYMAMPWSRAKAKIVEIEACPTQWLRLCALFDACFRIQREACEASGRHIPLIVENVRGAQRWVGRSRWNFGSFHLWGDVPALMPMTVRAQKFNPDGTAHPPGSWFAIADSKNRGAHTKNPGFRFDGSGRSMQSESVDRHIKNGGGSWFNIGSPGQKETNRNPVHALAGIKTAKDAAGGYGGGFGWDDTPLRRGNSKSTARKAASAMIAKIPLPLSSYIARTFHPQRVAA